jgi:hypothetical protein
MLMTTKDIVTNINACFLLQCKDTDRETGPPVLLKFYYMYGDR